MNERQKRLVVFAAACLLAGLILSALLGCAPVIKTWEAGHPLAGQHINKSGECWTAYTSEGSEIEWCAFCGGEGFALDAGSTPATSTIHIR